MTRPLVEETVRAYQAVDRLKALYDAYRATSRAHVMVVLRMTEALDENPRLSAEERARARLHMADEEALSHANDLAMGVRRHQLNRRLLDLMDLPELP